MRCWCHTACSRWLTNCPVGARAQIAIGTTYGCGIRVDNSFIECWGTNFNGAATPTSTTTEYSDVASGDATVCAIRVSDSKLDCWGKSLDQDATMTFSRLVAQQSTPGICGQGTDGSWKCWAGAPRFGFSSIYSDVAFGACTVPHMPWCVTSCNVERPLTCPPNRTLPLAFAVTNGFCGIKAADGALSCNPMTPPSGAFVDVCMVSSRAHRSCTPGRCSSSQPPLDDGEHAGQVVRLCRRRHRLHAVLGQLGKHRPTSQRAHRVCIRGVHCGTLCSRAT